MKRGCKGITTENRSCQGPVTGDNVYCWSHGGRIEPARVLYQCGAPNSHGKPCRAKVRRRGDRCRSHAQEPEA